MWILVVTILSNSNTVMPPGTSLSTKNINYPSTAILTNNNNNLLLFVPQCKAVSDQDLDCEINLQLKAVQEAQVIFVIEEILFPSISAHKRMPNADALLQEGIIKSLFTHL